MDNLTHTLTGLALSQAGLNRKTRFATLALIIGSTLPDIDIVTRLDSSATYLKYHRGFTHSILGATILGLLLAGAISVIARKAAPPKKGPPLVPRWLVAVCVIATLGHALLDFTNSYGIRPFLPFSGRWYGWDIMFITDPLLLAILIAGFALPALFRLISEEVGAARPGYRRGAVLALSGMVMLWGLRDLAHRRVLNELDSHTYRNQNPVELGAFPSPGNPFAWTGVVETDEAFHVLEANALDSDVDVDQARVFYKPSLTPPLQAAERSRTAVIFLNFARFPWANVEGSEEGFDVTLRDLRFISLSTRRQGFVAEVVLDKDLRVLAQSFSFTGRIRRAP